MIKEIIANAWTKEVPVEKLMKCSCGSVWPKPAEFCGYCGKKLHSFDAKSEGE